MFKTDNAAELSALHKSLLEAKFTLNPMNEEIPRSPIVADLSNRIYDELCREQEKKAKGSEAEWQEWRRIKSANGGYRGFWRTAVMSARGDLLFPNASPEDKRIIAKCLLSPFTCTEAEIDEFIAEADGTGVQKTLKMLAAEVALKGAELMKLEYLDSDVVHMALWLTNRKTCDIFFSGIRRFSVTAGGKSTPVPAELGKFSVSSSNGESFSGTFSVGNAKKDIEISADRVDYWI